MSVLLYAIPSVMWLISIVLLIASSLESLFLLFNIKNLKQYTNKDVKENINEHTKVHVKEDIKVKKLSWTSVIAHCFALPFAMAYGMVYRILQSCVVAPSKIAQTIEFIFISSVIIFIILWIISIAVIIIHLSFATKQEDLIYKRINKFA